MSRARRQDTESPLTSPTPPRIVSAFPIYRRRPLNLIALVAASQRRLTMPKKVQSRRTLLSLFSRVQRPLAVAALLLALALSVAFRPPSRVASTAACLTNSETLTRYYSDASHTTLVGTCHITCDSGKSCTGSTSPYYVVEDLGPCCYCGPSCGCVAC